MSRYAWLICEESKQMIWLGKIISNPDTHEVLYFHIGDASQPRNSENPRMVKSILKFFAQNIGKEIRVIPEEELDIRTDESFNEIGDDAALGELFDDYLDGFEG